nr:hypothetical protein [Nonomuraea pusilla]
MRYAAPGSLTYPAAGLGVSKTAVSTVARGSPTGAGTPRATA